MVLKMKKKEDGDKKWWLVDPITPTPLILSKI